MTLANPICPTLCTSSSSRSGRPIGGRCAATTSRSCGPRCSDQPTTAIARRLGRAAADLEVDVPFEAISASLAIPPRKAIDALRRLHHYGLIEFYEARANIAMSGWAPSVPGRVAVTLSAYARHAYGDLEADTFDSAVSPSRKRPDVLVPSR